MLRTSDRRVRTGALVLFAMILGSVGLGAQTELLPLDHPATITLIRLYEFGSIPEFPREHLPISRELATRLLRIAGDDSRLPPSLREQSRYYWEELAADDGITRTSVVISTGDSAHSVFDDPLAGHPLAIIDYRNAAAGARIVLEPVLDAELRVDPTSTSQRTVIGLVGGQARGSIAGHVGFSARVSNGSVAGDSALAARDSAIKHNGSFSVTGFGRDLGFSDGHVRVSYSGVGAEIGRERVQLGGGVDRSLLLSSLLPTRYDYVRLTAVLGRVSFSHIHGAILAEPTGTPNGPAAEIPDKYIAAHLVSIGPIAGMRLSVGESVIYSGRGMQIGYLNPLIFMKAQEQYLRDRDNTNLYMALSANPLDGLFLEGELMLDDLRYSEIGSGFWGNKSAWRVSARAIGFPIDQLDFGLSYTRLEPYVFTHFNRTNNYMHDATSLSAGGLEPNSFLLLPTIAFHPLPNLQVRAGFGIGEHGSNILLGDSILFNAGGDIRQTRRDIDPATVTFLDGERQKLVRINAEAEYEPIRNIYIRLKLMRYETSTDSTKTTDTQLWFGLRVGAH